jgi:hypothetical protein
MRCKVTLSAGDSYIDIEVKKGFFRYRKRVKRGRKTSERKRKAARKKGPSLRRVIALIRDMRGIVRVRQLKVNEKRAFSPEVYALYYGLVFWWTPGLVVRKDPDMDKELIIEGDIDVNLKKGGRFLWKRRQMF